MTVKLTNDELKKLPRNCFPFNAGGAVVINKKILTDICKELLKLRQESIQTERE
jgi:hypothetical protein